MPGPRLRTPSDAVVGSLVDAAAAVIQAEGATALTVRRIAAEAGVSPQSVYNHFDGKLGVVDAVFVLGFDALSAAFDDLPDGPPVHRLVEAALRYRAMARAHPGFYAVMFERAVPEFVPSDEAVGHARAAFDHLVDLVQVAMDGHVLRSADAVEVAQQLWSAIHGAVSLELRGLGFVDDVDAQYLRLVRSLLAGLAA